MRVGTTQDYRRAKGWELVRMDFGGNLGAVDDPYFVLYNRYISVLRVFMYVVDQTAYSKVLMTLRLLPATLAAPPSWQWLTCYW